MKTFSMLLLALSLTGCASTNQRLVGTSWRLEDLGGVPVAPQVVITLSFPDSTRATGNAGCNEYFGPATIERGVLRIGELSTTRKNCDEIYMVHERDFLEVIRDAQSYSISGPYLNVVVRSRPRPLRFTRTGS